MEKPDSMPSRRVLPPSQPIPDPHNPGKPISLSPDGLAAAKTVDLVEVGDQVRLFVLFDRPPLLASRRFWNSAQEPRRNPEDADWAESAGLPAVGVFDVLAPQLLFDGGGEPLDGLGAGQVVFFDQQRVIRRLGPGREEQVRLQRGSRQPRWAACTAAITWCSESFSPVRLE